MAVTYAHGWEGPLLARAQAARQAAGPRAPLPIHDVLLRRRAYTACAAVIAEHGKTFYLATGLLPPAKRQAVRALYAFCRTADNIVDATDAPVAVRAARLAAWRARALAAAPPPDDLVAVAWADTRRRYHVPATYSEQLLDGVARDLCQTRYDSFAELTTYAYGVASTVGLMMLRIIGTAPGCTEEAALPYAIKMGVALQLTNILRDVGEDWRAGRVYLPAAELAAWGLGPADLAAGPRWAGRPPARWQAFMGFQVARARALYRDAWPCVAMFARDGRFCVAAMCALYRAILDEIDTHAYDVFTHRAHVSTWGKLRRLPGIWGHLQWNAMT